MVETIRLESGHTLTGIVGSNPTLSAIFSPVCSRGGQHWLDGRRNYVVGLHGVANGAMQFDLLLKYRLALIESTCRSKRARA